MKKRLLLCGLCLLLLLSGCGSESKKIRFGAAGLGGIYHSFATSFGQLASAENDAYGFEVKATAGSAANLRLLSENYIQLAIAQTDLTNDAYYGKGNFEEKQYQGYGAIAGLYTDACQIVVRDDSEITSLDELLGKKVCIGESESGTEQNALQILQASGLSSDLVEKVNLNYTDAANALKSKEIDAFFCTAGIQTTVIEELARQCPIRLLEIDSDCARKLMSAYGFYEEFLIPSGTYTGQENEIKTLGIRSLLLASNKLPEQTVNDLTRLLFSKKQELQYSVPVDLQLDEGSASQGITIPFHDGAAAYYREQGIDISSESSAK